MGKYEDKTELYSVRVFMISAQHKSADKMRAHSFLGFRGVLPVPLHVCGVTVETAGYSLVGGYHNMH